MKRIFISILTICLIVIMPLSAAAHEITDQPYEIKGGTVQFESDSLSAEELEAILNDLAGDAETTQAINGFCLVFGHKLVRGNFKEIKHKVYEISPRCIENTYHIEVCSRCGYKEETLLSSQRIFCCS